MFVLFARRDVEFLTPWQGRGDDRKDFRSTLANQKTEMKNSSPLGIFMARGACVYVRCFNAPRLSAFFREGRATL